MALAMDESWTGDWLIENSQRGLKHAAGVNPDNKDCKALNFTT